ncbi:MAG: penicillin-binding transpeptidase domain-containing protein [Lachnospiraceae bacterium]|nr:penicillin-binding transpeptidase domain-containing protein [Lachnospiraceae bacterium]MDY5742737.1 penicillin-binding transpeptidase domain-containing protein [Lachnospiraceae bacterium]
MKRKKKNKILKRFVGEYVKVRMMVIYLAVLALFTVFVLRVLSLNLNKGDEYKKTILNQQQISNQEIPFQRGEIYDRDMGVLARSQRVYRLILDRNQIHDDRSETATDASGNQVKVSRYITPTVGALVKFFGFTEEEARAKLAETPNSYYEIINESISEEQKKRFEDYIAGTDLDKNQDQEFVAKEKKIRKNVKGIWFETTYKRVYPHDKLASQIIGFTVGQNGIEGLNGLELYYDKLLNGTNGRTYGYMEAGEGVQSRTKQPTNGHKVVTTIDSTVQSVIEDEIASFMKKNKNIVEQRAAAENVGIIVMNPQNGEVLGMATSNSYNLNQPRSFDNWYTKEEQQKMKLSEMSDTDKAKLLEQKWNNFCLSYTYEPGSVIKPLTVAAALETGSIKPGDTYYCAGSLQVGEHTIHCANRDGHGAQTLYQAVANSCNVALMEIGKKTGAEQLIKYQDIFNFGQKTGIDLPGENSGIIFSPQNMGEVEVATTSFGQGFNITMIQGAAAFSAAINGGNYYKPHIVKQILDENDHVIENIEPVVVKKTISGETEKQVKESIEYMINNSLSGSLAKIDHYKIGGKTGTAEVLTVDKNGVLGRDETNYVCSFWAAVPMEKPQLLIYVVVEKPNAENQAAFYEQVNIEKRVMSRLIPYYHLVGDDGKVYSAEPEKKTEKKEENPAGQSNGTQNHSGEQSGEQPASEPNGEEQSGAEQPQEQPGGDAQPTETPGTEEAPIEQAPFEERPVEERPVEQHTFEEQEPGQPTQ